MGYNSPIHRYSGACPALRSLKNSGFFFFISSAHALLFSKMRSWDCWRYLRTSCVFCAVILGNLRVVVVGEDEQYLAATVVASLKEGEEVEVNL